MDREIFSYKGAKCIFALISCLTILQGLCIISQAFFLASGVSGLFAGGSLRSAGRQVIFFFIFLAARYLCSLLIKMISERFAEQTSAALRVHFLAKLFKLGPKFVSREGTGNLVTLALEGVPQVRQYLQLFLPKMAANGILPILILCYIFVLDKISAIILIVTMPILILFMILLGLAAQKKMDDRWEAYRILSNHFIDSLRGLPTLRYLGLSALHAKSIERVSDKYRQMTMRTLSLAFMSSFALDFFSMLSIAFVAVALGLRLIDGHIGLFPALIVLILAPEFFLPVRELGQDYHATLDGKESAEKLRAYVQQENGYSDQTAIFPEKSWNKQSTMEIDQISFTYQGENKKALDSISFSTHGFEIIGIIGASGAGKSTLVDLISGFIRPDLGEVKINGQSVRLDTIAWRSQITYIPQHPYLFSGTLKENITFYAPESTDDQVHQAIEEAGLLTILNSFPHGLDEKIGAGARQLSGGQQQRVALARAFLCDRPILLLDEPTAHLDIETEYELKDTMIRLFKDKLVFMATHRLHWMEQMDRILVVQNGRLVESGRQEELLCKNAIYADLVRSQLEGV
ncbi:MAG: thiol reductant ABC exporter subunit CydD [Sporolactobacillus sp.]